MPSSIWQTLNRLPLRIFRQLRSRFRFPAGKTSRLSNSHLSVGAAGEQLAADYLTDLGMRILERNHRTPLHEIDLIALDDRTLVFVEVKTWNQARAGEGTPADSVDLNKQKRLTLAALAYLKSRRLLECRARFDVVEVLLQPSPPKIRHFQAAFEAVGDFQLFR